MRVIKLDKPRKDAEGKSVSTIITLNKIEHKAIEKFIGNTSRNRRLNMSRGHTIARDNVIKDLFQSLDGR